MKESPIIFSTPMDQAIIDGSKKQTRRRIKPQVDGYLFCNEWNPLQDMDPIKCPYGEPGSKLWVREKFRLSEPEDCTSCNSPCPVYPPVGVPIFYADFQCDGMKWKPSIHMKKEYANIWLEVLNVRVERLQDISEEDAKAEGMKSDPNDPCEPTHKGYFKTLWNDINEKRGFGWDMSPWVWVVEFRRTKR